MQRIGNKNTLIKSYVLSLENIISKAEYIEGKLNMQVQEYKQYELSCWEKKKYYDGVYVSALDTMDAISLQSAIDNAILYEWCATDSRVKYNAYKKLYSILVYYLNILQKRYGYWSNY